MFLVLHTNVSPLFGSRPNLTVKKCFPLTCGCGVKSNTHCDYVTITRRYYLVITKSDTNTMSNFNPVEYTLTMSTEHFTVSVTLPLKNIRRFYAITTLVLFIGYVDISNVFLGTHYEANHWL
jgi:hypothetical protein